MPGSIVLLSGGLDSTVNFKITLDGGSVLKALTFDYGQRAARRETEAAAAMCERFGVSHEAIRLPWLRRITTTALVRRDRSVPRPQNDELDAGGRASVSAAQVWVPNRNGAFLAIGASFAEALGADEVVPGFNREEAASFPDNSPEFIAAVNAALRFSTRSRVRVRCHTSRRKKRSILRLGLDIGAPLDLVWCCYEGGRAMCGQCESCLRFVRAVEAAGAEAWFREHHRRPPPAIGAAAERSSP